MVKEQHPVHRGLNLSTQRLWWLLPVILAFRGPGPLPVRGTEPSAPLSEKAAGALFLQHVGPLLQKKCHGCHGDGDERRAGLDLRTRPALLRGGDSGPAVVPGSAVKSLLYQAVTRTGDLKMPPKEREKLSAEELAAVRAWIDAGAPWPDPVAAAPVGKEGPWTSRSEDVWAFQPVKEYPVPTEGLDALVKTPIDAFVWQKLKARGLAPAPAADRRTLLRRVTYDLTGLPPTPEEIDAFVRDPAPDAFDKVVERLLASPAYGEHWGRHWLDVVRYADTSGYSNDFERPNVWRYRDYVIRSFNADKPYDRFVVEQLAGDELDPRDPELRVAAGFLRMGPWEHTGMAVAAVTRQMFLDDITNAVGTAFLALPLACARCHDHKFDPIPTRDYYRVQAVFAPVHFEQPPTPFLPGENRAGFEEATAHVQERIRSNETRLQAIKDKSRVALQTLLQKYNVRDVKDLSPEVRPKDNRFGLDAADQERERVYRKRVELYDRELKRYQPLAFSVSSGGLDGRAPTPPVHILAGGALSAPGAPVTPGVLSVVPGSDDTAAPSAWNTIPPATVGRRLALARWIASPANPLTARVMVNRVWQYHFGTGLVATSNNFGKMGKRPTHPELLDWLARYFVEQGWSVKALHRLILRSAVYQCGSEHPERERVRKLDPANQLLAYFPPRRLTAEELRDSLLAVAGELSRTAGGPGVFPEINPEVALQPRQIMGTIAPVYEPSPKREQRHRRTVYTYQMRNLPNPLLEVFNGPTMDASCERREETTVTPQVFALFNSQLAHDLALMMARRLEKLAGERAEQVNQAFRLAFGRPPTEPERARCLEHLAAMTAHHRRVPPVKVEPPRQLVRSHIAELTGAHFDFVEDWDPSRYEPNLHPAEVSAETRALAELCLVLVNATEFLYIY
jgi:mono/diheme cytochrome c family protein